MRTIACVVVLLLGCQRPAAAPPPRAGYPGLAQCEALTVAASDPDVDEEPWRAALDACSSALQARAAHIMALFHAGDCDGLYAYAGTDARRDEARFIAALLDHLGDERGRALQMDVVPRNEGDALDGVEALSDTSGLLSADEGCHPALCGKGNELACSPWFGLEAPGACVPVRLGSAAGCMPAYCMENHELLTLAARRDRPGARAMLVRELAMADGYVWGSLCHCGVRGGIAERDAWEQLASAPDEKEALDDCFADAPGNTTASCFEVDDKPSQRTCGQPSRKR